MQNSNHVGVFGIGDSEWAVDIDSRVLLSETRKQTKGAMTNK